MNQSIRFRPPPKGGGDPAAERRTYRQPVHFLFGPAVHPEEFSSITCRKARICAPNPNFSQPIRLSAALHQWVRRRFGTVSGIAAPSPINDGSASQARNGPVGPSPALSSKTFLTVYVGLQISKNRVAIEGALSLSSAWFRRLPGCRWTLAGGRYRPKGARPCLVGSRPATPGSRVEIGDNGTPSRIEPKTGGGGGSTGPRCTAIECGASVDHKMSGIRGFVLFDPWVDPQPMDGMKDGLQSSPHWGKDPVLRENHQV